MKRFLLALQFLTIIPIKIKTDIKPKDYGRALLFFPPAGLIIGCLLSLCLVIFNSTAALVQAAIIIIVYVFITGALHLDGFADTCDGLYAARTQQQALDIMRDPRCGVMGVIGLVCFLLFQFTLLASMPESILWKSLILMCAFSRWAMAFACYRTIYPRKEGKAKFFVENARVKDIRWGGIFVFFLFLIFGGFSHVAIFILASTVVVGFKKYIEKKMGAMTGDTIGATGEIAQISVLFFTLLVS